MSEIKDKKKFLVYTITKLPDDAPKYCHWAEALSMTICKDGITLKLDSEEIQQLVKSLPKTMGGSY
jgi:hypothetical protein